MNRLAGAVLDRAWLLLALLSAAAFVAAGVLWLGADTPTTRSAASTAGPSTTPSPTPSPTPSTTPSPVSSPAPASSQEPRADPAAGAPERVVVASLGIDAPVVPVAAQGTSLTPPDDPQVLGWWSGGAPVGAAHGTALVTGHTVHSGGGAMDDLERIRPGSGIHVTTAAGVLVYVAESVRVLDKTALADQAPRLFDQSVPGRLALVTCEDWDGSGYRSNVVVTARLSS